MFDNNMEYSLCIAWMSAGGVMNGRMLCCADPAAGLALCWPVSGEAAGRNHRSCHPSFQHPSADPQLH